MGNTTAPLRRRPIDPAVHDSKDESLVWTLLSHIHKLVCSRNGRRSKSKVLDLPNERHLDLGMSTSVSMLNLSRNS